MFRDTKSEAGSINISSNLPILVRSLIEPSFKLDELERRYRARLLASLLLLFLPLLAILLLVRPMFVAGRDRIFWTLVVNAVVLVAAYGLSRTQHYSAGVWLTLGVMTGSIFINLILDPTNGNALFFLILPALLSSVLLSWRPALISSSLILLIGLSLIGTLAELHFGELLIPLGFVVLTSALILHFVNYRDQLEAGRLRALAVSEKRWHMMINQSPLSTVVYSADGRVRLFNPAALELWRLSPEKLARVMATYNILEDERLREIGTIEHIERAFAGKPSTAPPARFDFAPSESDPDTLDFRWIIGHFYPVADETGVVQEVVVVHQDITELRQTAETLRRQESLAAVGQMAAGIAHDFNNIMAVITLYSQLLLHSAQLSERERSQLETILEQSTHASELTSQILDFSRQSILELKPVTVTPMLQELSQLLRQTMPKHIHISVDQDKGPHLINADRGRLQQVIMNLALNARDAMPEGGELCLQLARLSVSPKQPAPVAALSSGSWIRITIRDSGRGVSPADLPHLFEPFFTTKRPGQGTGLGLAQVYGIIKQHDGHIHVTSRLGEGTSFDIYLPALPESGPTAAPAPPRDVGKGNHERIMVVEDESATRAALVASLESLNYQVLEAGNGQEALALLTAEQATISLLLTDFIMPDMNGAALLQAMRSRGFNIPAIILTGHTGIENLAEIRASGACELLTKPIKIEHLAEVVSHHLKNVTAGIS